MLMTKSFIFVLGILVGAWSPLVRAASHPGELISATSFRVESANVLQNRINLFKNFGLPAVPPVKNGIEYFKIVYLTQGLRGDLVSASGLIVLPQNIDKSSPTSIVVYQHGTITDSKDAPSVASQTGEATGIATLFGGGGYMVLMPDYLGYGTSAGLHPYLHAHSEATAGADLMVAASELALQNGITLSNEVSLTGYSQGGHATLALHKYLESSENQSGMTVKNSVPMAGPYDLLATVTAGASSGGSLIFSAFSLLGLNSAEPFCNDISEVFRAPYSTTLPFYYDGLHTRAEIEAQLPKTLDELLTDKFTEGLSNGTSPFFKVLMNNSLVDWTPLAPVYLIHSKGDDVVPFINAESARDSFTKTGAKVELLELKGAPKHGAGALLAFVSSYLWILQH